VRAAGFPRPQIAFEAESIKLGFRPTVLAQSVPAYGGPLADAQKHVPNGAGLVQAEEQLRSALSGDAGTSTQAR